MAQPGRTATALLNNTPSPSSANSPPPKPPSANSASQSSSPNSTSPTLYTLPLKQVTAHDLSRFQAVERDFSFVFPDTIHWHTIASAIHALAIPELQSLTPSKICRDNANSTPASTHSSSATSSNPTTAPSAKKSSRTGQSAIIDTLTALGGIIRAPGSADKA